MSRHKKKWVFGGAGLAIVALAAVAMAGLSAPVESKALLQQYKRALSNEVKALKHRQGFELKDLDASQTARLKEWKQKEKEARHAYFSKLPKGAEKRTFMKDHLARYAALRQVLKDELSQRKLEQESKLKALKEDQAAREKEFEEILKRGETPPERLWPVAGK